MGVLVRDRERERGGEVEELRAAQLLVSAAYSFTSWGARVLNLSVPDEKGVRLLFRTACPADRQTTRNSRAESGGYVLGWSINVPDGSRTQL